MTLRGPDEPAPAVLPMDGPAEAMETVGNGRSRSPRLTRRRLLGAGSLGLLASSGAVGWLYAREPETPWYVTRGTENVRLSYAYAVNHPEELRHIPCYCGCGTRLGHDSVLDCFVAGRDLFGRTRYNDHGVSCRLCVAVVRDAMDRVAAGKPLAQVRAEVDRFFSPYANDATDTPHPLGHGEAGNGGSE